MQRSIARLAALALVLGMTLLPSLVTSAARPAAATLPPVTQKDGRAGLCYSFYPGPQGQDRYYLPLAVQAGSRWDRFDFVWPRLEPQDNQWDNDVLAAYDDLVNDLRNAGVQNIVGILLWTPDWAATQTGGAVGMEMLLAGQRPFGWYAPTSRLLMAPRAVSAASSPPRNLYNSWSPQNFNDNYWARFVYKTVSRYSAQGVKYWEMWNEPEWNVFWSGTSTEYTQLLKVGYQATKAACPDCKVLFGGLHYWINRNYYRWVLNQINQDPAAPQNNYFFDIMSVHLYSRSSSTYDEILNIRAGMTTYNVGNHPIWLTETGVPVWGDPYGWVPNIPKYDYAATAGEAAAYVIQSYANALAAGVERYFFFRTNDDWCDKNHDGDCADEGVDGGMTEVFGLVRDNGALRPAYAAYQVAATYLVSPTFVTRAVAADSVNVTLWGTPRGKVSVLWNPGPTPTVYKLAAARPTATLVYTSGVTQTITANAGFYTLTLPGATANLVSEPNDYFIGGDPLIVIESETVNQPPTSTVQPLPPETLTPAFTVAWAGADNESGVQFYDVQVRDGPDGAWTLWQQLTTGTSGVFSGAHGHTYYFRVRAIDRVGNRGDWSQPVSTTLYLASTLNLTVGPFFADDNRNGVQDAGESALTGVKAVFHNSAGQELASATVDGSWGFTTTILAGQTYWLRLTKTTPMTDYIRFRPFTWPRGREVYTESLGVVGLWPAKHFYLPLVMRRYP